MAEKSGKVGAFYATSGTGTLITAESGTLVANVIWLSQKNVKVEKVYKNRTGGGGEWPRFYCTPRGKLTVEEVGVTGILSVKYRWWAEEGETGSTKGIVKQYGGFFNWAIDDTADVVETTDFQDSGTKTFLATLDGWTGTAERHWINKKMLAKLGSEVIAKFYVDDDDSDKGVGSASDTGSRYEGYCHIVGLSPTLAVDSLLNESLSFQGTGQLVYEAG